MRWCTPSQQTLASISAKEILVTVKWQRRSKYCHLLCITSMDTLVLWTTQKLKRKRLHWESPMAVTAAQNVSIIWRSASPSAFPLSLVTNLVMTVLVSLHTSHPPSGTASRTKSMPSPQVPQHRLVPWTILFSQVLLCGAKSASSKLRPRLWLCEVPFATKTLLVPPCHPKRISPSPVPWTLVCTQSMLLKKWVWCHRINNLSC
jgi:hypothetical protein